MLGEAVREREREREHQKSYVVVIFEKCHICGGVFEDANRHYYPWHLLCKRWPQTDFISIEQGP